VARLLAFLGLSTAILAAYLLLWPVPIEPVAWVAPPDRGFVDPFATNDQLGPATGIDLRAFEGPEDATLGLDGAIYATTLSGHVIRVANGRVSEFAYVGGRPLGIETDRDGTFVVANAYTGIQRVDLQGRVTTLVDSVLGRPLVFANSLAIGPDGRIYFSESSSKFGAEKYADTYGATFLDVLEHGAHGSLFAFDPESGRTDLLLDGLNYANGVAISEDGSFLVVADMANYRILRYWLDGPGRNTTEVLLDNLPGFTDNLKTGRNGRFWAGFAAPRKAILDRFSDSPLVRKVIYRLPSFLRPEAARISHVFAFNGDGEILMNLHDPDARFPTLTGVLETRRNLYLTTLFGNELPWIAKRDL